MNKLSSAVKFQDIKYLLAYLVPVSTVLAIQYAGFWSFSTLILGFVLIPVFEEILPTNSHNITQPEIINERGESMFFDVLLYLNIPLVFSILVYLFHSLSQNQYSLTEYTGLLLSTGIMLGSNGINVAHEIGHRSGNVPKFAAGFLLLPSLYMHFTTEHNRGHHLKVGTPEDPATSRFKENLFSFWFRSITGGWFSAWKLQKQELTKNACSIFSWRNSMLWFCLFQTGWVAGIYFIWGWLTAIGAVIIAVISILLLESINYIEHYGLTRSKNKNGIYDRVEIFHSWNSDHQLGRIILYELTRHSDHHYKASKKYQLLNHSDLSPQLPYGYPASILIAMVPPLWFRIMNPRVAEWRDRYCQKN